ncbi:hypothetical protein hamaS1_06190 [Moorella sp. Hama-1]|nr:hypothetical protein [Moorella sp. (in: firmicutes)]BCV20550.1 hypothetical protein hamaS1_06190 [Moorella sp. Hama-1]
MSFMLHLFYRLINEVTFVKRRHKIAITIITALAVTVGAVRLVAPDVLGIPYPPGVVERTLPDY